MNYFLIGHVFLAGTGMYFLAHRWFGNRFAAMLAGLVFAWNGLSIRSSHVALPYRGAGMDATWVVLLCEKAAAQGGAPSLFGAALAGACQMMTGSPEIIPFTWCIPCGLRGAIARQRQNALKMALRFAAVAGWVAVLSAANGRPGFIWWRTATGVNAFDKAGWPLPVRGAANFLAPLFRGQGLGERSVRSRARNCFHR